MSNDDVTLENLRLSLASAYSFIRGRELTQTASALTFEELLDRQLERLEGQPPPGRLNELDRIAKVRAELDRTATQAGEFTSSEYPDDSVDVNTPTD